MQKQEVKLYDEVSSLELVAPNLWEVDKCFGDQTFKWLVNIKETEGNEFVAGALSKRLQLKYNTHDQARLNQIGQDMIPALEQVVGIKLNFMEAKYWLDLPEFGCQTHADSKDLVVNFQVYLDSALRFAIGHRTAMTTECADLLLDPATTMVAQAARFYHVDPPIDIEFKPNHGYINLNTDFKQHDVRGTADTRVSVMFQYARV